MPITHVGLWYDEVEAWTVSLDGINKGHEITKVQFRFRGAQDDDKVYEKARERAIELGREKSLPVLETAENGMLTNIETL